MKSPFISIFIPVYNGAQYLKETLDSILAQQFTNYEVLCVDDSSTDNSHAILQSYASKDNRFRVYKKLNGGSVPPSWQFIIPHIKGDHTLYMSQDDLLLPETLQLLVNRLEETGADAVMPTEYLYFEKDDGQSKYIPIGVPSLQDKVITGKDAFRLILDYSIPGFSLWPTRIIKQYEVPTETFNADEYLQRLWISQCRNVAFSTGVFLYRCDNPEAITKRHSPLHYEVVLTNAMIMSLAEDVLSNEDTLLDELATAYFTDLYSRMLLYHQRKSGYSPTTRKRVESCFAKAYSTLRKRAMAKNWKTRISKHSYTSMKMVVALKCMRYRFKGVTLSTDIDLPPITTPRKYR